MCGLVGYFSKNQHYNEDKLKNLLLYNETRGKDSSGLFIKNGEDVSLVKSVGTVSENLLPNIKFPKEGNLIIGHTRAKTQGAVVKENSHPFQYGTIIGAHNGRITNAWGLCLDHGLKSTDYDVDSMVVYALMNKFKVEGHEDYIVKTIKLLEGPQALLFTDLEFPNRLYFFRRYTDVLYDKRPLFRGQIRQNDEEQHYFSSLKDSLKSINCHSIQEVKEDVLYYFDEEGHLHYENIKFEPKKTITTYYPQTQHQTTIGFKKTNVKDDAIDWNEILNDEYPKALNNHKTQSDNSSKKKHEITQCEDCLGSGNFGNTNITCDSCGGSGWLTKEVSSSDFGLNIKNYEKGDTVLIIAGEKKGYLAKYQIRCNDDSRKSILTLITNTETGNIPNYFFNTDFIKYKSKSGVIMCTLDKLMDRYNVEKIKSDISLINTVKNNQIIQMHTKNIKFPEKQDFQTGDIIIYDSEDNEKLLAEVINFNKTYSLLEICNLSKDLYGVTEEIQIFVDNVCLVVKNNDRIDSTIVDICDTLTSYHPRSLQIEKITTQILDTDDKLSEILSEIKSGDDLRTKICNLKYSNYVFLKDMFNDELNEINELKEASI